MRVLVLDSQYQPIEILDWKKAVTLVIMQKAEILGEYNYEIRSPNVSIKMPSVIRKIKAKFKYRDVSFNRRNLFMRDNYRCQYCNKHKLYSELTFDHVIPVAQNGETTWENIVACCKPCNIKKAGRTPEQAKMPLMTKPEKPKWHKIFHLRVSTGDPQEWFYYIEKPE